MSVDARFPGSRDERGQVAVFFALLLPVLLALSGFVIGIGNWYTHAKHLQTKADAGAFAGGGVWAFPCGPVGGDVDQRIEAAARDYAGPHVKADGTPYLGTTYNPQVGGVPGSDIHAVLNGPAWYDDDSNPSPTEFTDPSDPSGSLCETKTLDVKLTEDNSFPLASLIPLFPDIKRKARVEIHKITAETGFLPISVRVPKPRSAAAVFYDQTTGNIIPNGNGGPGVVYFCQLSGLGGLPAGLAAWSTYDGTNCTDQMRINGSSMPYNISVAIATSFRPACSATITSNCFEDTGFATVDQLCRQPQGSGTIVECFFDADPTDGVQTVASGLQFIHGFQANPAVTNGPPELRDAWLASGGCGSGYFAAVTVDCDATLHADIDLGSVTVPNPPGPPNETRTVPNTEVKWKIAYGTGGGDDICNFGPSCDLGGSGSGPVTGWVTGGTSTPLTFSPDHARYAIALRIRLQNTPVPGKPRCSDPGFSGRCEWYFTGAGRQDTEPNNAFILEHPVQRSFMGDDDRSGPIRFLRLTRDTGCAGDPADFVLDNEAGSQPDNQSWCYFVDMGLKGAIAQDQDEPPIAFNLKASQSASLDCDPTLPNLKDEVVAGCKTISFATNDFAQTPPCPNVTNWSGMLSPPPQYDWPPITCVLTQTGNPTQLIDGFLERLFGDSTNPVCPDEFNSAAPEFVRGRNYWHDANNLNDVDKYTFASLVRAHGSGFNIKPDPRLVKLFMTGFSSFGGSGNALFPIVNFGSFYITGIGVGRPGGGVDVLDPCNQGNSDPSVGAGNKPPPDLKTEPGGAYVWGHFVDNVDPEPGAIPSGEMCEPEVDFMPCVAVLVE